VNDYPTNLTDKQWQVIKNVLETKERKRKYSLREMINAMMYLIKTDCQWRMLPTDFGPWQTVYFYFRKWKFEGVFDELMHYLRQAVRKAKGRKASPSIGIIDSRSVRTSHHIDSAEYGIDGGKKVKGRKEHIIVDSLGLPMAAWVFTTSLITNKQGDFLNVYPAIVFSTSGFDRAEVSNIYFAHNEYVFFQSQSPQI
jgi:putative transposase